MVEIVGSTVGNTIQVLHYILESTLPVLLPALLPLATASLVPLAAAPVGLAGLAGLAGLTPAATAPMPAPAFAMAPTPPPAPAPAPLTPAPAPVTVAHAPAVAPPPPPPPTPAGPPVVTMPGFMYLVGALGLAAQRAAGTGTRAKKVAVAGSAVTPAAAPVPDQRQPARRRRPAKTAMIGRGYEYMDLEAEPTVVGSEGDAGTVGFAGSAPRGSVAEPAGLATLIPDQFGGDSTLPMLPGTWNSDLD